MKKFEDPITFINGALRKRNTCSDGSGTDNECDDGSGIANCCQPGSDIWPNNCNVGEDPI